MLRRDRSLTSSTRRQVMRVRIEAERIAVLQVVVDHGGQQVVGGGDGMEVTGQVQVELLERDDLAVAAPGGAALDSEGRPHGRLTDRDGGSLAEAGQGLPETDRRGRLSLTQWRRGDGRNDDVASLGPVGQGLHGAQADLGHVGAVVLEQVGRNPHLRGDVLNGPQRRPACDLDGWGKRHLTNPGLGSEPICASVRRDMLHHASPGVASTEPRKLVRLPRVFRVGKERVSTARCE